ncbi:hypothetical protein [Streptomyces subrutilus]|uniref:Uncharacterized protein n=1 Tax=Streptomyces subrutilus TaxID=36818 RepID=A0A1E5PU04_9ACTN|nr:hypothetical protein [Streptomyces subrutilus]OEJ33007.1 hypothetical protein BGK67_18280 [Streptomyces subrutilus]
MEHEQTIPEQRKEEETRPDSDTPAAAAESVEPATPAEPAPVESAEPAEPAAPAESAEPAAPAGSAAPAVAPRRRRGRTTLLIAGAAVLGVLAGTVTGYAVQYHREPTALPPLAQQKLVTPKALAPDDTTTNKTINANRWHKTDDDLGKMLIEAPGGAKSDGTGYDSLDYFSVNFERPEAAFRDLATAGVRRMASTAWSEGDRVFVQVNLIQFNDFSGADDYQKEQSAYMPEEKFAGNQGVSIPGVPDDLGHVWVDSKLQEKAGYHPLREGRAVARRGDIVLDIFYVENRGKVSESDVIELAKRQLERL